MKIVKDQDTCSVSTMRRSYGPHMPEHRHLLFTSVDPQSGTSEHRGGKLRSKSLSNTSSH